MYSSRVNLKPYGGATRVNEWLFPRLMNAHYDLIIHTHRSVQWRTLSKYVVVKTKYSACVPDCHT